MKTFDHPFEAITHAATGEEALLTGDDHPPLLVSTAPPPGHFAVVLSPQAAQWVISRAAKAVDKGTHDCLLEEIMDQLPRCLYCGDTGRRLAGNVHGGVEHCFCPKGMRAASDASIAESGWEG